MFENAYEVLAYLSKQCSMFEPVKQEFERLKEENEELKNATKKLTATILMGGI